jgi:transcriptional regulator with XRE-family HTH domain
MKNTNRKSVATNLKTYMDKASLAPEALAKKAGISRYQLDNLLYCRALNIATLEKVATVLNVRVDRLLRDINTNDLDNHLDIRIYSQIIASIDKILTEYNLHTTRFVIDKIANLVYENYKSIQDLDETVRGIILSMREIDPDIKEMKPTK